MEVTPSPVASESGHWYRRDGSPAYTVVGKNGKERATTLRDARKLELLPSVTTISRLAARPGLERWKAEQVLMAALTLPRKDGESEASWVSRVWLDAQEQARIAAERGAAIHGAIERLYAGQPVEPRLMPFAQAAVDAVFFAFGGLRWEPEKSFAADNLYGGKVDLHSLDLGGAVVDFKTKDGDVSGSKFYDEHAVQLAAYRVGLGIPKARCAVVFVSRDNPQAYLAGIPDEDLDRGWKQFAALMDYFYATTGLV